MHTHTQKERCPWPTHTRLDRTLKADDFIFPRFLIAQTHVIRSCNLIFFFFMKPSTTFFFCSKNFLVMNSRNEVGSSIFGRSSPVRTLISSLFLLVNEQQWVSKKIFKKKKSFVTYKRNQVKLLTTEFWRKKKEGGEKRKKQNGFEVVKIRELAARGKQMTWLSTGKNNHFRWRNSGIDNKGRKKWKKELSQIFNVRIGWR